MKSLLILYAEVMPYNVICFEDFVRQTQGQVHVVHWSKLKKLTPYTPPNDNKNIIYYPIDAFDLNKLKALVVHIKPSALYIVGRMEKMYLDCALWAKSRNIITIGCADTQFSGSFKQHLYRMFSRLLWRRYFDYVFVPGLFQYEYMRFLGFKRAQILFPQYCADVKLFNASYQHNKLSGENNEYILFVGRFNTVKGIHILIQAYEELVDDKLIDLKLLLIGNGPFADKIPLRDNIIVRNFSSQEELVSILGKVKFFCLPSIQEPWGLVIHEFAAAGLPIITTTVCGAASAFVKQGYNGYLIPPNSIPALKEAILKMNSLPSEELKIFSTRSYILSRQITPEMWTSSILSII